MILQELIDMITREAQIPMCMIFTAILCPKWKYSLKTTALLITILNIIFITFNSLIYSYGKEDASVAALMIIIDSCLCLVAMFFLSDVELTLFTYIFLSSLSFTFGSEAFSKTLAYFCDVPLSASRVLIYIEIIVLEVVVFKPVFMKTIKYLDKDWLTRSMIPGAFITCFLINDLMNVSRVYTNSYMVPALLLSVMQGIIYLVTYRSFRLYVSGSEYAIMKIKQLMSNENMTKQIENIEALNEEIHTIRHDLRHSIKLVSTLIANGKTEEAQAALQVFDDKLDQTVDVTHISVYTGIFQFDALLSFYASICSRNGIEFKVELSCFDAYADNFSSIAVIFTNALDNAVEAASKAKSDKPFIRIRDISNGSNVMIEFSNTCTEEVVFDKKGMPVTERQGHGLGIPSIFNIAETVFGGGADCELEDNVFTLRIYFISNADEAEV